MHTARSGNCQLLVTKFAASFLHLLHRCVAEKYSLPSCKLKLLFNRGDKKCDRSLGIAGIVVQWCNPLRLQPEQSGPGTGFDSR